MNENEKIPLILIVEDDEDMASLNARMLRRQGFEALVAHTVAEARALAAARDVDLYVLDITLPDGDGLEFCAELRRQTDAPIVFLTGRKESADKVTGLNAGGDYYLTKPFDRDEFSAVVRGMLRRARQTRERFLEAQVFARGSLTVNHHEGKAYVGGRDAALTQREFAVLQLLIQNEGRELSYDEIYRHVWGVGINNDSNALRQLMSRMKRKLGEEDTDDFSIRNEHKRGYIFTTD